MISAAVAFLLWYTFERGAHEIQPLVPALQSYWMKIHVPANFVGYGAFALAAMVAVAYLLRNRAEQVAPDGFFATRLPPLEMLDDVMYKAIALRLAAPAPDQGLARHAAGLVGHRGSVRDPVCLPRREHVPVGAALLRGTVGGSAGRSFSACPLRAGSGRSSPRQC